MSEVPVQLIVAAFRDEKAAKEALKELKQLKKEKLIGIQDAAVITKDKKGKIHIKETADMGGGKGAAFGGVVGAVIGLIAGPALLIPVAIGALVGGLTAKLVDTGFDDDRLKQLGDSLTPGSSAIVAVVEHKWVAEVERELAEAQADVITAALSEDIASQLEADHDVAYTALASEEGFATSRVAGNEEEAEGSEMVITDESTYAAQYVATKDGIAVRSIEVTDDAVLLEEGVVTADGAVVTAALTTEEGTVAGVVTATPEEG